MAGTTTEVSPETSSSAHNKLVPLHRLYSPHTSNHFYTISEKERQEAESAGGYIYERVAALVFPSDTAGVACEPIYRIFRSSKDNFYTTHPVERSVVLAQADTVDMGVACFVPKRQVPGTVPFYRLFNPLLNDHLYTTDPNERNTCIGHLQYNNECIMSYVYPADSAGSVDA